MEQEFYKYFDFKHGYFVQYFIRKIYVDSVQPAVATKVFFIMKNSPRGIFLAFSIHLKRHEQYHFSDAISDDRHNEEFLTDNILS